MCSGSYPKWVGIAYFPFIFSPKCTIFAYPTFNERDVKIPTHPVNLLLGKLLEDHQKTKKSTSGPPTPQPLLETPKLPHTKSDFLSPHKTLFFLDRRSTCRSSWKRYFTVTVLILRCESVFFCIFLPPTIWCIGLSSQITIFQFINLIKTISLLTA